MSERVCMHGMYRLLSTTFGGRKSNASTPSCQATPVNSRRIRARGGFSYNTLTHAYISILECI